MFRLRAGGLAALLSVTVTCAAAPVASNVSVDRFEARMVVDPRGSAEVEETWLLRPAGGGDGWLRRIVPGGRHDGLQRVSATLGDRPVDRDADGAVTWRLAAGGGPQTATLRYTAAGVVEVSGGRGRVTWLALDPPTPAIATVRLSFSLPDAIAVLDRPVVVEPGWQVSQAAGQGAVAERTSFNAGESATLISDLSIDAGTMARPAWQEHKERATFLAPAFISGGLFIVVVGAGVVVMVLAQRRTWTSADQTSIVRSLVMAGIVSVVLSGLLALVIPRLLVNYGSSPLAIPVGIAVVGGLLVATGWALRIRAVRH